MTEFEQNLVSVVVPAYNEEENLPILLGQIINALEPAGYKFEVLYVDDGSTDNTRDVIAGLVAQDPRVVGIFLAKNCGQTAALEAGVTRARGAIVLTMDADLQNDPADAPKLLEHMGEFDAVVGYRAKRQDSILKKITSRVGNGIRNWATKDNIRDTGCSLKAFKIEFLLAMPWFKGMHRFMPTLVKMRGGTVKQIAVNHRPRIHGESKYGLMNRMFATYADLRAVRWMQSRTILWAIGQEVRKEAS